MVSTRNPLNIGAAARAMANFGFARLAVVNPYDVAFREARSAVGAAPLLRKAQEFSSVAEAVADCRLVVGTTSLGHRELHHPIRRLEYGGRLIRRMLAQAKVALLFGSEKFGLSNDDLSHCHWLMRIPTVDQRLSMNLGQAVALCLYELARDPKAAAARPEKIRAATARETEQIAVRLLDALRQSGYVNPATAASTEEKVRRLVLRLDIGARDAPVLLGMLRQILWKLDAPDGEIRVDASHMNQCALFRATVDLMTISLRKLPEEVEKAILETSRREGISLNKATLRLLEERTAQAGSELGFRGVFRNMVGCGGRCVQHGPRRDASGGSRGLGGGRVNVLLDTSAYSALQRGNQSVLEVMRRSETVAVSAVVLGELYSGFRAGSRWAENTAQLTRFLSKPSVRVLSVTEETALRYAEVDVYLRKNGRRIPRNDVWIAAAALEHGLQLLTLDTRFREIPLLLIEP